MDKGAVGRQWPDGPGSGPGLLSMSSKVRREIGGEGLCAQSRQVCGRGRGCRRQVEGDNSGGIGGGTLRYKICVIHFGGGMRSHPFL